MAWFGNVSLGNFPDLAGAVNKLSESVKNIEKNFDSALGLEEKSPPVEASGIWTSASDRKILFEPVMSFTGHRGDDSTAEASGKQESSEHPLLPEERIRSSADGSSASMAIVSVPMDVESEDTVIKEKDGTIIQDKDGSEPHTTDINPTIPEELDRVRDEALAESSIVQANADPSIMTAVDYSLLFPHEGAEVETSDELQSDKSKSTWSDGETQTKSIALSVPIVLHQEIESLASHQKPEEAPELVSDEVSPVYLDVPDSGAASLETETSGAIAIDTTQSESPTKDSDKHSQHSTSSLNDSSRDFDPASHDTSVPSELVEIVSHEMDPEADSKEKSVGTTINVSDSVYPKHEVDKVKKEMKLMEAALQGAARQAQAKADEIARLMNENEQLKSNIDDLKRNSRDAEIDTLHDEYRQRVAALERKVYALTRERDTLRREQSKKSDAAFLLKEKDEIISQVMAEGEELSKKQAAQESTIRKLRAQIREFEEEKQRLNSKLQVEETKVESIKKDKAATEKLLQETLDRNQEELAAQKEFYANALNAAKEAEALAEARVNSEARIELESRLKEAGERESMLVQALDELRQTLSRTEQQAVFKEDMLRRDIDDLQNRYQASELRYNELVTQVPESTRPLLRQIEAMQETSARRAEAWAGVERALNSRLQEAEAKAASAEEKERAMNERLSQSLSRITVLETQIACLRTEQTQLSRSLEKERQRASESRQEYLVALEEAATQEGRAKQLEDEMKDLRSKHKLELLEEITKLELLEKELERQRMARSELEKTASGYTSVLTNQEYTTKFNNRGPENEKAPIRKISSAASMGSMEESLFLQASLDSSNNFLERRASGETTMSPYFLKSMTPSAFEAALRQKDGEVASYVSRLSSLESIRDSLSEELVKMTEQCEKLRTESAVLPGIRAELEALRRRHSSALELMGERDEALEELRADIADLKEMYREQVDLLVNKIQVLSSSVAA